VKEVTEREAVNKTLAAARRQAAEVNAGHRARHGDGNKTYVKQNNTSYVRAFNSGESKLAANLKDTISLMVGISG
jgi:hypothetical protein